MDTFVADHGAKAMVERLVRATNEHDLDGIAGCFAVDFRSETPVHPERSFTGRDQVRRNWEQILTFVPDVTAELLRCAVDGNTAWTEWEHRGTRRDGSPHLLRGSIIFGAADGLVQWARIYLEPVQLGGDDINAAIHRDVARPTLS